MYQHLASSILSHEDPNVKPQNFDADVEKIQEYKVNNRGSNKVNTMQKSHQQ